jgi:hypothetical protein
MPSGLRDTNMVPVLLLEPPMPPMNDTMCSTSGSARTMALRRSWRVSMLANEVSCGDSEKPDSVPVSCCGNSPLGTSRYRYTVSTRVAQVSRSIQMECRSTTRSERS